MDYKQLKIFLSQENENKSIPLFGIIEPTDRCNLQCTHCYIPKNKKYTNARKELSLLEIKTFLQTISKEGCLEILFTGGEPFIRKDFLDIYTFTKKLGIIPSIYTNGTLITPQIADYLQRWRPFFIEITLYGATAKTYETITGIPGSFKKCLNGIKLLKERKIPLGLKVVVMKENLHEFYAIKKMAEKFNILFRFSTVIDAKLDGSKDPFKHRISINKGVELEMATKDYRKGWEESSREREKEMEKRRGYLYYCNGGLHTFHLNPFGDLSFCTFMHSGLNVRNKSFKEIFYKYFPKIRSQLVPENYKCNNCKIRSICDQCPARAKMNTGDSTKIVNYFCKYAHLRAKYVNL